MFGRTVGARRWRGRGVRLSGSTLWRYTAPDPARKRAAARAKAKRVRRQKARTR